MRIEFAIDTWYLVHENTACHTLVGVVAPRARPLNGRKANPVANREEGRSLLYRYTTGGAGVSLLELMGTKQ